MKRGSIGLSCKACGNQSLVDLRHKLCTYILSHPPQKKEAGKAKKEQTGSSEEESTSDLAGVQENGKESSSQNDVRLV